MAVLTKQLMKKTLFPQSEAEVWKSLGRQSGAQAMYMLILDRPQTFQRHVKWSLVKATSTVSLVSFQDYAGNLIVTTEVK